ncbi:hypothetical protein QTN24_17640 [Cupriavidus sp. SZY C1]|uniref:hypothetical protein n=1 Tax=Cupriavidus sp. SZY C1 TaxID=3055037 RepID=UPI0028BAAB0C|nr:hypothetical protein [Cupriavidus sp. SZY C1]MDT6963325.1 hypothetical protein [Cupriavidus sp. SZY C1]
MATQQYYGHTVEGTAVFVGEEQWRATARVTQGGAALVQSCEIGIFRTRERAMAEGLAWGKRWIDCNQCPGAGLGHADGHAVLSDAEGA